jgi:hypothetical protein
LEDYRTSLKGVIDQYKLAEQLQTPEIMHKQAVDDLAQGWRDATDAIADYMEANENGGLDFDVTAWLADMENQTARANEIKADLVGLPPEIRTAAATVWGEQGVLAADALIDTFQGATPDMQARMVALLGAAGMGAGTAAGEAAVAEMERLVAGFKPSVEVQMIPNNSAILAWSPPLKTGYVNYVPNNPFQAALDAKYGPN